MSLVEIKSLNVYIVLIYNMIFGLPGRLLGQVYTAFPLYIFTYIFQEYFLFSFSFSFVLQRFFEYIFYKLSRDQTCPLGKPRGLKGLFHMLSATVIFTKGSQVFHVDISSLLLYLRTSKIQVLGYLFEHQMCPFKYFLSLDFSIIVGIIFGFYLVFVSLHGK